METDPDGPENETETDHLVEHEESQICDELLEKGSETSTLLSRRMAGQSSSSASRSDEVDSRTTENKQHPHPYHLRNKYTFRSDSVYSDVIPMSAASHNTNSKTSDPREKSGSLSSLKAKESKWTTLKKKLGKLNSQPSYPSSHSSEKAEEKESRERPPPINKALHEKRSLFQRAKTLSILPVHKTSKDKEEVSQTKNQRVIQEKELFNVGGEMNLIPLELLINVNDLDINK